MPKQANIATLSKGVNIIHYYHLPLSENKDSPMFLVHISNKGILKISSLLCDIYVNILWRCGFLLHVFCHARIESVTLTIFGIKVSGTPADIHIHLVMMETTHSFGSKDRS